MTKVEVFSADCPVCRETVEMVQNAQCCKESDVVVRECSGDTCCQPAKDYKIQALPSIVVDGQLAIEGKPTLRELKNVVGEKCAV